MSTGYSMEPLTETGKPSKRPLVVGAVVVLAVGIAVGVVIGYFSRKVPPPSEGKGGFGPGVPEKITSDATPGITQKIIEETRAENIDNILKQWTKKPQLAGTEEDKITAERLKDTWKQQGLDPVQLAPYQVLLSYPDKNNPNKVTLEYTNGTVFQTQLIEKPLRQEQREYKDEIVAPFHGYSPAGNVTGPLVYVNYGTIEDFQILRNLGMNLTGTIAIARYGKVFRGSKVLNAQNYGCVGVVLYSDPADYAPYGTDPANVYPNMEWLPETGVQRGSVLGLSSYAGDPLTPGYPSTDTAYRIPMADAVTLPKIPSHPISYGDAVHFLSVLNGTKVPEDWRGNLNITYRFGPGLRDNIGTVRLEVAATFETKTIYNVIGYLKGEVEPDRYVLLGNHRDAWVFGGVDPTSGTATQVEVSRVLGKLYKEGWRPRRTLVFCSWAAEEYGLIGSAEWVEHYQRALVERSAVYLNVDSASSGCVRLAGAGVPLLHDSMYLVARKIPNPMDERSTVYDAWKEPSEQEPRINQLGSGSDHAMFVLRLGIPAMDVRYRPASGVPGNPLYHSSYSTYHYVKSFLDPDFKCHQAVARYWAEMGRYMADSLILPFNVTRYSQELKSYTDDLKKEYGESMRRNNVSLDELDKALEEFATAATAFQNRLSSVNKNNPMETRKINDQMMQLERAFTDQAGIPGRPLQKHLMFAPSSHNVYAGSTYPGMEDAMFEIERDPNAKQRWEKVKQHLSVIIFVIKSAASTLKPVTEFGS